MTLRSPYVWWGGKRLIAEQVWTRLGSDVPNYVEPFFGSGAAMLARPGDPPFGYETANDLNGYVVNFWRAMVHDPGAVARHCDHPVFELDQHARHQWLRDRRASLVEDLVRDPEYSDPKVAGWWVWGHCAWIGSGWCSERKASRQKPSHRPTGYMGKRPQVRAKGVNAQLSWGQKPKIHKGMGVHARERVLLDWFDALSLRMRRVTLLCGDWTRCVTPAVTGVSNTRRNMGMLPCAVFLDPPYSLEERAAGLYTEDRPGLALEVADWARENGSNPDLRIALCGYEGEHSMPEDWTLLRWSAQGNMGGSERARANRHREVIWFSPHCLDPSEPTQGSLF